MDSCFKDSKDAPPRVVGQVFIFHDKVNAYWSSFKPPTLVRIWVLFYLFRFSHCQLSLVKPFSFFWVSVFVNTGIGVYLKSWLQFINISQKKSNRYIIEKSLASFQRSYSWNISLVTGVRLWTVLFVSEDAVFCVMDIITPTCLI